MIVFFFLSNVYIMFGLIYDHITHWYLCSKQKMNPQ